MRETGSRNEIEKEIDTGTTKWMKETSQGTFETQIEMSEIVPKRPDPNKRTRHSGIHPN
jgi:hypothetical protein